MALRAEGVICLRPRFLSNIVIASVAIRFDIVLNAAFISSPESPPSTIWLWIHLRLRTTDEVFMVLREKKHRSIRIYTTSSPTPSRTSSVSPLNLVHMVTTTIIRTRGWSYWNLLSDLTVYLIKAALEFLIQVKTKKIRVQLFEWINSWSFS